MKRGDEVKLTFLDHCEDGGVLKFSVWGRVHKADKNQVQVACWDYAKAIKGKDENMKVFSIVRNAIVEARVY